MLVVRKPIEMRDIHAFSLPSWNYIITHKKNQKEASWESMDMKQQQQQQQQQQHQQEQHNNQQQMQLSGIVFTI